MKFKTQINLGNDSMQTGGDVARALRGIAARIERAAGGDLRGVRNAEGELIAIDGKILDDNGNTVGAWKVSR